MADLVTLLSQGRAGGILPAAQSFQNLQAGKLNQLLAQQQGQRAQQGFELQQETRALQNKQLEQQISDNEYNQLQALDAPRKAELQGKLNQVAAMATQAKTPEQLISAVSSQGLTPDPILTDDSLPFEMKQASLLAKSDLYKNALSGKQAGSVKIVDAGDKTHIIAPNGETIRTISKGITPSQQPKNVKKKEEAKQIGSAQGKLIAQEGKRGAVLSAKDAQVNNVNEHINEAYKMAGTLTTGFIGGISSGTPGAPAHDLKLKLDTIKANIGFDKLQEMRDSSPTGGALGQVSENENRLLQSVFASLEQSASEEEFKKNLRKVQRQVKLSWERVAKAYEKDYGKQYNGESSPFKQIGNYRVREK